MKKLIFLAFVLAFGVRCAYADPGGSGFASKYKAEDVTVKTTSLGGNLPTTTNTVQKLADVIDNLTLGTGTVNTGVSGYFAYYPGAGTIVDDQTALYLVGGNIGIGTTVAPQVLTITGNGILTGNVGIGTTQVSSVLNFPAGTTAAGGIAFGTDVNLYRVSQSGSVGLKSDTGFVPARLVIGTTLDNSASNIDVVSASNTSGTATGLAMTKSNSNAGGNAMGVSATVTVSGAGSGTTSTGISTTSIRSTNTGGNAGTLYGGKFISQYTGTGTNVDSFGIYAQTQKTTSASGSITTAYSIYADTPLASGGGTIDTSYNFYGNGTAFNYFGGNVGIGTTTIPQALTVTGSGIFSTAAISPLFSANAGVLTLGNIGATAEDLTITCGSSNACDISSTTGPTFTVKRPWVFGSGSNVAFQTNPVTFSDNVNAAFGNGSDAEFQFDTAETNDTMKFGLVVNSVNDSGNFAIVELADIDINFGYALVTDPHLIVQSSDATTVTDNVQIWHDETDGNISTGGGNLKITPAGGTTVVTGAISATTTMTSSRTTDLGWSVVAAANQACNTTCTSACAGGLDQGTLGAVLPSLVGCSDATADQCYCAGSS